MFASFFICPLNGHLDYSSTVFLCQPSNGHFFLFVVDFFSKIHIMDHVKEVIALSGERVSTFRERFVELIESSPKSRTSIANEFGVAKQTVSAWITGQSSPRLPVVSALAEYFGVDSAWLLGYDVPKSSSHNSNEKELTFEGYLEIGKQHGYVYPGILSSEEQSLLKDFNNLSIRGQELLLFRMEELKLLYGKKPEDSSAESV